VDRAGNVRPYAFNREPLRIGRAPLHDGIGPRHHAPKRFLAANAPAKGCSTLALTIPASLCVTRDLLANRVYFTRAGPRCLATRRSSRRLGEELHQWNHRTTAMCSCGHSPTDQGRERRNSTANIAYPTRRLVDLGALVAVKVRSDETGRGAAPHGHLDQRHEAARPRRTRYYSSHRERHRPAEPRAAARPPSSRQS